MAHGVSQDIMVMPPMITSLTKVWPVLVTKVYMGAVLTSHVMALSRTGGVRGVLGGQLGPPLPRGSTYAGRDWSATYDGGGGRGRLAGEGSRVARNGRER